MSNFSITLCIIYFFSLSSTLLVKFNFNKLGNFVGYFCALLAFVSAALRPENFPDYGTYKVIFEESSKIFDGQSFWNIHSEPGYKLINFFISLLGLKYDSLLVFMSFLSLILLIVISRISEIKFVYLWFAYFSLYYVTRDLGVIRVSIASHLIVISVLQHSLANKIAINLISCATFQYYSFVTLISIFFNKLKPNFKIIYLLLILSVLSAFLIKMDNINFLVPSVNKGYIGDIQGSIAYSKVVFPFIRNLLLGILIYYFMFIILNKKNYVIIWMVIFSILSYVAFSGILVLAHRFGAYFGAVYPIAFAIILNHSNLSTRYFIFIISILFMNFLTVIFHNKWVWMT